MSAMIVNPFWFSIESDVPTSPMAGKEAFILGAGGWTWFNDDRAIRLSQDRMAVTSIQGNGDGGNVIVYDVDFSTDPFTVSSRQSKTNGYLADSGGVNDHSNGALFKMGNGNILHLAVGHNDSDEYAVSSSVSGLSWVDTGLANSGATYANLFDLNGTIYQFGRYNSPNWKLYVAQFNGTDTWSGMTDWIDDSGARPYFKFAQTSADRVDFIITDNHPNTGNQNIYHGYFDATDETFRTSAGVLVTTPAVPSDFTKIRNANSENAWLWDLVYHSGNLYAAIVTYPDTFYNHRYRRLNNTSVDGNGYWEDELITAGLGGVYPQEILYSGGVVMDPDDPDTVFASRALIHTFNSSNYSMGDLQRFKRQVSGDWLPDRYWGISHFDEKGEDLTFRPVLLQDPRALLVMSGFYRDYEDFRTRVIALDPDAPANVSAPVSARAWRLRILGADSSCDNMQLENIEFRDSAGVDQTGSGTAIASSILSGSFVAANAFDGGSSRWAASGHFGHWIGYDFGAGNDVEVHEVFYEPSSSFGSQGIMTAVLEYSDDVSSWTPYCMLPRPMPFSRQTVRRLPAAGITYPVMNVSGLLQDSSITKAYRFYRWDFLQHNRSSTGNDRFEIETLRLRNSGGDNLCSTIGGTAYGNFDLFNSKTPANAFSEGPDFYEGISGRGDPNMLIWDFGDGNEQQAHDMQITARSSGGRCPEGFLFSASNNGITWDTLLYRVDDAPANGATKTYTL